MRPVAVQVVAGSDGTLTAKVRSTLALTYQWKKDGVALATGTLYAGAAGTVAASSAETTLTLRLINASDLTPGSYTLFVTNAQGNATSTGAAVTVSFSKPKFLEVTLVKAARTFDVRSLLEPIGPTLPAGLVVLGVSATAGKRTFAWFREGTDGQSVLLSAGSTGFLRLDPVRASDAGAYFVVVTDPEGNSVKSRPAVVTILTAAD